jgi:hypothetical protein
LQHNSHWLTAKSYIRRRRRQLFLIVRRRQKNPSHGGKGLMDSSLIFAENTQATHEAS